MVEAHLFGLIGQICRAQRLLIRLRVNHPEVEPESGTSVWHDGSTFWHLGYVAMPEKTRGPWTKDSSPSNDVQPLRLV